jgi:uncharacterized protein (TIGR01777 family)
MRIVISGASGLIGTELRRHLGESGHDVAQLVRRTPAAGQVQWDPASGNLDPAALAGADAVINLGGAGIGDKRLSEERKQLVLSSRVDSTSLLAGTMAAMDAPPPVFLSASAIGFYGDRGDAALDESSPSGAADDFLVHVVEAWESAAQPAAAAGIRTVLMRSGIVLDNDEGALGKMLLPYKLGIGGKLGSGDQWWSWIALQDEVRAISHLLTSALSGPVNLTAPNPVTNKAFVDVLGEVLKRPTVLPVPKFALSALLGSDRADALVFTSAKVLPKKLLEDGFVFDYPELRAALAATLA